MKQLPIRDTNQLATVDDEDFEYLSKFTWRARGSVSIARRYTKTVKHFTNEGVFTKSTRDYVYVSLANEIMKDFSSQVYDHKNRNHFDCRKDNLRKCDNSQNNINRTRFAGGTSKYKGVSWHEISKKWRAMIYINNKQIYIGVFKTEEEAALAWNEKAKELHKEFAVLNQIERKTNDTRTNSSEVV